MLTVKLVEHNGHEQIHEVQGVSSEPNPERTKLENHSAWRVYARKLDGECLTFVNYGVLYVMNDAGQTVAKYWLGYGQEDAPAAAAAPSSIAA